MALRRPTASLQFRWLAQPRLHGLFVGEVLVFLLFKEKLIKHANHRMRQEAVHTTGKGVEMMKDAYARSCVFKYNNGSAGIGDGLKRY